MKDNKSKENFKNNFTRYSHLQLYIIIFSIKSEDNKRKTKI